MLSIRESPTALPPNNLTIKLIQDPSFQRWVRFNSEDDAAYWEKWSQENPEHRAELEQARAMVEGIPFSKELIPQHQIDSSWNKLSQQIKKSPSTSLRLISVPVRYAAAIIILLLAASTWWLINTNSPVEYYTPYGVTQQIKLEDGTIVVLNGNSILSIDKDWLEKPEREMFLEGEAYFSVVSRIGNQQKVPFIVETPDLEIKVLGTEFNVNSRRGRTQVVLDEGKVTLDIPEVSEATMKPGEYVQYSSEDKTFTRRQVNPAIYTSWRNHLLTLDDTPLSQIIRQLEDTYGVQFVLSDESIRNRKISSTGSISAEDLPTILAAIGTLLQIRIVQDNNTIYVYEN